MTAPVFRPTIQATLEDLNKRVRALEAVSGGGVSKIEVFQGNPVTLPADGSQATLEWTHTFGSSLFDLTAPAQPLIIEPGDYIIALWAAYLTGAGFGVNWGLPTYEGSGSFFAKLVLDVAGPAVQISGSAPLDTLIVGGPATFLQPSVPLAAPYSFLAGMEVQARAAQGSGADRQGGIQFGIAMKLGSRSITP